MPTHKTSFAIIAVLRAFVKALSCTDNGYSMYGEFRQQSFNDRSDIRQQRFLICHIYAIQCLCATLQRSLPRQQKWRQCTMFQTQL
ncbi:hypothetical protein ACHAWO_012726 [Cyclotella atomus]|uniref:Secreted protein n=1 Tax=Cyclotella atomus TaxID=382360 RepID=A0ABD3Q0N4_9STRA